MPTEVKGREVWGGGKQKETELGGKKERWKRVRSSALSRNALGDWCSFSGITITFILCRLFQRTALWSSRFSTEKTMPWMCCLSQVSFKRLNRSKPACFHLIERLVHAQAPDRCHKDSCFYIVCFHSQSYCVCFYNISGWLSVRAPFQQNFASCPCNCRHTSKLFLSKYDFFYSANWAVTLRWFLFQCLAHGSFVFKVSGAEGGGFIHFKAEWTEESCKMW